MARRLIRTVSVGTRTYKPGDIVPEDDAAQITNPRAWADDTDADPAPVSMPTQAGTNSGARLARTVWVGADRYGPSDPIPDAVAAQITNPLAWEGGKVPADLTAAADTGDNASTDTGDAGPADGDTPAEEPAGDDTAAKARRTKRA